MYVISLAWQDAAQQDLHTMVSECVSEAVRDETTDWCHPILVVSKLKGGVRITADYTKLNLFVTRPTHPFPTPNNALCQIKRNQSIAQLSLPDVDVTDASEHQWDLCHQETSSVGVQMQYLT